MLSDVSCPEHRTFSAEPSSAPVDSEEPPVLDEIHSTETETETPPVEVGDLFK